MNKRRKGAQKGAKRGDTKWYCPLKKEIQKGKNATRWMEIHNTTIKDN